MNRVSLFLKSRAGMGIVTLALLFGGFHFVKVSQAKRKAEAAEARRDTVDKSKLGQMSPETEPVPVEGAGFRSSTVGEGKVVSYAPAPYTPPPPPPPPVRKPVPVREKAPPPPPPVPKLVHRVGKAEAKPFSYRFPRAFAPAGTMIPCYLSITVDSANFETPVVGKVEEPVFYNKRLIIPEGTEVHATARQGRLRDRVAITGTWRLVWSDGKELRLRGIALDRKYDPAKDTYGITDGSAGLRGTLYKGEQNEELKLLAASFASGLSRASQRQSTGAFGLRAPDVTLGNSIREGAANVADRWADRILEDILTEGYYVRVPAGTQFYIYATQTIEPELASLGGLKQSQRAATSHDLARAEHEERQEAYPADTAEPGGLNVTDTHAILRQREMQMETAKLYLEAREKARREEERRERIRSGEEPEGPPPPPERTHLPRTNSNPYQLPQANGR